MKTISPKKLFIPLVISTTLLSSGSRLTAQTLSLTPTSVDGITHSFDGIEGGLDSQGLTFAPLSVQLVNFDTIQISVDAPAGQAWNVAYNSGLQLATFRLSVYYAEGFGGPFDSINSGNWQLTYASGSDASLNGNFVNNSAIPNAGNQLIFDLYEGVTGSFSFTSITASITYDNSTLAADALHSFTGAYLSYQYQLSDFEAPDPGQQLTFVPTPEPLTLALMALGGFGLCLRFRRRTL
ncbi:MAG: PEP-CTERM sorting domain-containing protein [Limisphaerales bacterium]